MPIEVRAVSKEDFAKWLADAKKKFAHADESTPAVRMADRATSEIQ
jgi:heme/copper-type cytochrome/quinol oxidase subunit 2